MRMPIRKEGIIYYGDVLTGKKTYEQYIENCFERNKEIKCPREFGCFSLCGKCPKAKGTKYEQKKA